MTNGLAEADPIILDEISRSGPELILATKPYAVDSTLRSWWAILSTTALLVAAVMGTLLAPHWALRLGCSVLTGLLLLRLFVIIMTSSTTRSCRSRRLAEWFMRGFGILSLSPSSIWRASHNHHHNHNSKIKGSHIGSFPIMTREHFEKARKSARWLYLFMRHPLTILFGYLTIFLHGMCLRPFVTKPREHWDCLIAVAVHFGIAAWLLLTFGWQAWLITQVIPHFIASAIGSYLFYAQHNFPACLFTTSRAGPMIVRRWSLPAS
jgi:omega-6 fatty acid desaturase (delta-12 desaturase)